jgi:putative protease
MEYLAGRATNYYKKIGVARIEVSDQLEVGDHIHFKGHTTDFEQTIESMEIKHEQITKASIGQVVGLKVMDYVRKHDLVYRVED